jgi:hypothetical protein
MFDFGGVTAPAISFVGPSVYTNANSRDFEVHRAAVKEEAWNGTKRCKYIQRNKTVKDLATTN